jgi:hypothetical protein
MTTTYPWIQVHDESGKTVGKVRRFTKFTWEAVRHGPPTNVNKALLCSQSEAEKWIRKGQQ